MSHLSPGAIIVIALLCLLLSFVGLKVTGVIDWSWWLVTSPLTVGLLAAALMIIDWLRGSQS